jgi:hypothetical protein
MSWRSALTTVVATLILPGAVWAQERTGRVEIKDLGFEKQPAMQIEVPQEILKERRFMLRQHQIWGLVALGGIAATVLTAEEKELPPEHPLLAGITIGAYSASAYFALVAPDVPAKNGGTAMSWHNGLAWVHLPGIILTPILGYLAAKKVQDGEKLDGIEKHHRDVAGVTAAALAASVLMVTFEF